MTGYLNADGFDRGIAKLVFQPFWLSCMIVKDLFEKPTSRKLGERLTTGIGYNMQTIARYALFKGACPDTKDENFTMLTRAARAGMTGIVRRLLKAGADPNLIGPLGDTPLLAAVSEGRTGAVALLLKSGAAVDRPDKYGLTPLLAAAIGGHTAIVEELLKYSPDVLKSASYHGSSCFSALEHAKSKDYHDVVALLEPAVAAAEAALAAQSGAAATALQSGAAGGFNPAAAAIPVMEPIRLKTGNAPSSFVTP